MSKIVNLMLGLTLGMSWIEVSSASSKKKVTTTNISLTEITGTGRSVNVEEIMESSATILGHIVEIIKSIDWSKCNCCNGKNIERSIGSSENLPSIYDTEQKTEVTTEWTREEASTIKPIVNNNKETRVSNMTRSKSAGSLLNSSTASVFQQPLVSDYEEDAASE